MILRMSLTYIYIPNLFSWVKMTAIKHALQRDIFTPNDERLLSIVNVCKAGKKKKNCFLCATGGYVVRKSSCIAFFYFLEDFFSFLKYSRFSSWKAVEPANLFLKIFFNWVDTKEFLFYIYDMKTNHTVILGFLQTINTFNLVVVK